MNKKNKVGKLVAEAARKTAQRSADTVCGIVFYQPQLPESVKKLRRF